MRIGIDAHILGAKKGGVETYIRGLVKALARTQRQDEYVIYVRPECGMCQGDLPANFRLKLLPCGNLWAQRSLVIPHLYGRDRLDVIHLQRALPLWGCERSVLHVHDAHYRTHPGLFPFWKRSILNALIRSSGRRATRVITSTEAGREQIIRHYGVDPDKIEAIPIGLDADALFPIRDEALLAGARREWAGGARFAVYLGGIDRHKNVHHLIAAFDVFRRTCGDFRLVIVGPGGQAGRGGYQEELTDLIGRLGCGGDVVFTGYVSDEQRRLLLNAAAMLVFPSTVEGFGLPPMEAMACGVPVITADIPVMREVYGDAAVRVQPGDPAALADAMTRLATDEELVRRQVQQGLQLARRHRWERIVPRIVDVYRSAARADRKQSS